MSLLDNQIYVSTLTLLSHDPEGNMEQLLREILEWEKNHPPENEHLGFEWYEVHGDPRTLNSLVIKRILRVTLHTNKCTIYRTVDPKAIEKALNDYEGTFTQEVVTEETPKDLFKIVTHHDEKKEILLRSLKAEKPVHCLLWGSVASAKTLMLEELARLPRSRFILGSSLTKAGIFDVLFNERPQYLILDELDKVEDPENLTALLSLMHKGYVTETKYRRHRTIRLKTWVFASANIISKLPRELLSRFLLLKFRDYTDDEFREVSVDVLREQEDVSERLGIYIADKVLRELQSRDVRDCCKVARLLKEQTKEEVDKLIEILKIQK